MAKLGNVRLAPPSKGPRYGRFARGLGADEEGRVPMTTQACAAPFPTNRRIQVCAKWSKPLGKVSDAQSACKLMRGAIDGDRESFYAVHLDVRHRVIGVEEVAKGTIDGVEVGMREIFKSAMLSNAKSMIVAHNHPSGDPSPSRADIEITKAIAKAGKLMGISVLDHIILGAEGCRGLRDGIVDHGIEFGRARLGKRKRRR